jgi:hypothetical protein
MKKIILALLAIAPLAMAQTQQPHHLKEDDARTGSNIRRETAFSSVPFDKSYADLSDSEKRIVRSVYQRMAEDDEPPYPARGTAGIFRALQEIGRKLRLGDEGVLDMTVMVDASGRGTTVNVYKTPSPELARAMAGVLILENYKPALCHGQPCAQEFSFVVKIKRRY